MPQSMEVYTFRFKFCYTERTFYLSFTPRTTIQEFTEFVTDYVSNSYSNNQVEIVEVGLPQDEQAPKINYHNDYTLRDIYGHKWRNTAFYIRVMPN